MNHGQWHANEVESERTNGEPQRTNGEPQRTNDVRTHANGATRGRGQL
jgi:hypothetical protein